MKKYYRRKKLYKRSLKKVQKKNSRMFISAGLIKYEPRGNNNFPFPPRYRTKLICSNYGDANSGAASGDIRFAFPINSLLTPYNQVTPTQAFTWNGLAVNGQDPIGFTTLCNTNFYRNYRVIRSTISVQVNPQSVLDGVVCTITPSVANTLPSTVGFALSNRLTKTAEFNQARSSGQLRRGVLSNSITQHKFLGVRRQAIEDDLSDNYTGTSTVNPVRALWWVVNMETGDNTILNQNLECIFKLVYEVEFYNDVSTTLPQ